MELPEGWPLEVGSRDIACPLSECLQTKGTSRQRGPSGTVEAREESVIEGGRIDVSGCD